MWHMLVEGRGGPGMSYAIILDLKTVSVSKPAARLVASKRQQSSCHLHLTLFKHTWLSTMGSAGVN